MTQTYADSMLRPLLRSRQGDCACAQKLANAHTREIMSPSWWWWVKLRFWLLGKLKALLQRIPCSRESFLVLSSGRSGSTLLMQYLRCHPDITCSLTEPLNAEILRSHGIPDSNVSPGTLINYIMAQLLSWRRHTGCKIFCQQLEFYRISFSDLLTALYDPPVIVLFREDALATYISLQLAFKTDVWFSQDENKECTTVEVDPDDYKGHTEWQRQRWRNTLSAFVGRTKKRVHFISYEELIADKERALEGVFSFLGLPPCKTEAYSKRQNPFNLRQIISNYEGIEEKLNSVGCNVLSKEWMKRCTE